MTTIEPDIATAEADKGSKLTKEERAALEFATIQWQNLQAQVYEEKQRAGQLDPKPPKKTNSQLAAVAAHARKVWEEGGRLRRIAGEAEIGCDVCKGARWVRNGNAFPPAAMPCPSCFHPWYAEQIRRRWRVSAEEEAQGKKAFQNRPDAPQMTNVLRAVKAFGRKVIAGKADMLAITGDVGIGKTHLMLMLRHQVDKADRGVIYRTASHIRERMQSFDTLTEEYRTRMMNDMQRAPLLILDEAEKGLREPRDDSDKGAWFNGQILDLINARHNAGLATAIVGNDLFRLPRPILSRLQAKGCEFIHVTATPDARPLLGGTAATS